MDGLGGERVQVSFLDSRRKLRGRVKKLGSWFLRFRRWANREDLRYTSLGDGQWIAIDDVGPKGSGQRRRRMKELRE